MWNLRETVTAQSILPKRTNYNQLADFNYRAYSWGVAIYDKCVCANSIEAPSTILSVLDDGFVYSSTIVN